MEAKSVSLSINRRETNLSEVLQMNKIYTNSAKGDLAKKEELDNFFPKMSYDDIVKMILDKGEIQVSEKERNLNIQNVKNDVANIIVEKTYNTETGLPFPINMILQVLDDINFQLKEDRDAKKQALKAIKMIIDKNILPIERKYMQINVTIKNQKIQEKDFPDFKTKFLNFLTEIHAQIIDSNTNDPKSFCIKCNILPNHYREILTDYEECKILLIFSYQYRNPF